MHTRIVLFSLLPLLIAGGCGKEAADAARAKAHEDSLRALGPAGWTDDELIAYIASASSMLAGHKATLERQGRSRAVLAFGRSMIAQHTRLAAAADSLARGRIVQLSPFAVTDELERYEEAMRDARNMQDFDLRYVTLAQAALRETRTELDRAATPTRDAPASALLARTRSALQSQYRTVGELRTALEAARDARARTAPRTKR